MADKNISRLVKTLGKTDNFNIGDETEVPYLKGTRGKITGQDGDVFEVEYTHPKSGITRKERFYKEEFPARLLHDLYKEAYPSDPQTEDYETKKRHEEYDQINEEIKKEADPFDSTLKQFFSEEEIKNLKPADIDLLRDFFGRFNNPKKKK